MRRLAAAILAVLLLAGPARAANPPAGLTIIEPYGPGSITDRIVGLLKPALEQQTGHPVIVEHDGANSLAKLAAAKPDGHTVIVVDLLSVEIAEAIGKAPRLSALTPVAKLTGPGSVALVVPRSSPIRIWAISPRPPKAALSEIALPGRVSAVGVPLALMEKALDVHFNDVAAADRDPNPRARSPARKPTPPSSSPRRCFRSPGPRPRRCGRSRPSAPTQPAPAAGADAPGIGRQAAQLDHDRDRGVRPTGLDAVALERLIADFAEAGKAAKTNPAAARLASDDRRRGVLRERWNATPGDQRRRGSAALMAETMNPERLTLYGSFTSSSSYKPMLYLALARAAVFVPHRQPEDRHAERRRNTWRSTAGAWCRRCATGG